LLITLDEFVHSKLAPMKEKPRCLQTVLVTHPEDFQPEDATHSEFPGITGTQFVAFNTAFNAAAVRQLRGWCA